MTVDAFVSDPRSEKYKFVLFDPFIDCCSWVCFRSDLHTALYIYITNRLVWIKSEWIVDKDADKFFSITPPSVTNALVDVSIRLPS